MFSLLRFPRLIALLLLPLLAFLPDAAFASSDDVFTVYAYGNGNVLREIFEGMKGLVDDEGYRYMIMTVLLLTMIFALTKGYLFARPTAGPIVGIVLLGMGLNLALFGGVGRTDIHIQDPVHNEDYIVSDMPLILAGAAALSSEMSRYLVKLVEGYYIGPTIPPEMWMSHNNTYNFANKIIAGLKDVTISDPLTKATFNSYMRECVVPAMYQGKINLQDLLYGKSADFWQRLRVENKARASLCFDGCGGIEDPNATCTSTVCPTPLGEVGTTLTAGQWRQGMPATCPSSHTALGERIEHLIGATAFNGMGNAMLRDTDLLDQVVSSTVTHITGLTGGSGVEHYQRAGMMNMFKEASANVIANGGSPGVIQVLGIEQAKATQRTNWMVAGSVFGESVAYLWAALQAFIFAIFPIAIVLMIFPGIGGKAAYGYFGLLAWISLWMPFLAIINYLSMAWLAEDVRQLAMNPLSYASLQPISEAGANMMGITTFLGTMVPILTYGMVRGGEFALTQFAMEGSAPVASQQQAGQIAGKSYSYGSIAANNVGMNKFDSTTSYAMGTSVVQQREGAGAYQHLREMSGAAHSRFGSPMSVTSSAGAGAETSKGAGFAMQNGQSFTVSHESARSFMSGAEQGINVSSAASEQTMSQRQTLRQMSDDYRAQVGTALDWSDATTRTLSNVQGLSHQGTLSARGSAITAGIFTMLGTEGLGRARAGAEVDLSQRLASAGGARAFLEKYSGGDLQFGSDKDAEAWLRSQNDVLVAAQNANPQMAPEAVKNALVLGKFAQDYRAGKLSDQDLHALESGGAAPHGFGAKVQEAAKVLSETDGGTLLRQGAAGAAGVGGAVIGVGAGTVQFGLGVLQSVPVLGKIAKNVIQTDGIIQHAGTVDSRDAVDNKTGASLRASDTTQIGQLFSASDSLSLADQHIRLSSKKLDTGFKLAAQNTQGVRMSGNEDAGYSYTATENTSLKKSAGVNASWSDGDISGQFASRTMADAIVRVRNPDEELGTAQDIVNKGRENARIKIADLDARTAARNNERPDKPVVPTVSANDQQRVDDAHRKGPTVNAPADPAAQTAPLPQQGPLPGAAERKAAVEAGRGDLVKKYQDGAGKTIHALAEVGEAVREFAAPMSGTVAGKSDNATYAAGDLLDKTLDQFAPDQSMQKKEEKPEPAKK